MRFTWLRCPVQCFSRLREPCSSAPIGLPVPPPRRAVRWRRRGTALALGLALLLAGMVHAAETDGSSQARALLAQIEAKSAEGSAAREPIERSKQAMQRAASARKQNQEQQARLLDDLALEWAQTARDLVEVASLEQQARVLEDKLLAAETKVRRARALLEETEMRRGRAQTELMRLDPTSELLPSAAPSGASASSSAPASAGAPPGAAPAMGSTAPSSAPTPRAVPSARVP